jgi:hypothetical protein
VEGYLQTDNATSLSRATPSILPDASRHSITRAEAAEIQELYYRVEESHAFACERVKIVTEESAAQSQALHAEVEELRSALEKADQSQSLREMQHRRDCERLQEVAEDGNMLRNEINLLLVEQQKLHCEEKEISTLENLVCELKSESSCKIHRLHTNLDEVHNMHRVLERHRALERACNEEMVGENAALHNSLQVLQREEVRLHNELDMQRLSEKSVSQDVVAATRCDGVSSTMPPLGQRRSQTVIEMKDRFRAPSPIAAFKPKKAMPVIGEAGSWMSRAAAIGDDQTREALAWHLALKELQSQSSCEIEELQGNVRSLEGQQRKQEEELVRLLYTEVALQGESTQQAVDLQESQTKLQSLQQILDVQSSSENIHNQLIAEEAATVQETLEKLTDDSLHMGSQEVAELRCTLEALKSESACLSSLEQVTAELQVSLADKNEILQNQERELAHVRSQRDQVRDLRNQCVSDQIDPQRSAEELILKHGEEVAALEQMVTDLRSESADLVPLRIENVELRQQVNLQNVELVDSREKVILFQKEMYSRVEESHAFACDRIDVLTEERSYQKDELQAQAHELRSASEMRTEVGELFDHLEKSHQLQKNMEEQHTQELSNKTAQVADLEAAGSLGQSMLEKREKELEELREELNKATQQHSAWSPIQAEVHGEASCSLNSTLPDRHLGSQVPPYMFEACQSGKPQKLVWEVLQALDTMQTSLPEDFNLVGSALPFAEQQSVTALHIHIYMKKGECSNLSGTFMYLFV